MKYVARDIAACMDVALLRNRAIENELDRRIDYYFKTVANCRIFAEKLDIPWQEVMNCFRGNNAKFLKVDLWEKVAHPGFLVHEMMNS